MKKFKGNLKAVVATSLIWATALSATAVFANTAVFVQGTRAPIHVVVNGERVTFTPDTAPVNIEGRNFLPVAALAEALNMPVHWDGATSTVYLGARAGVPTAFTNAVPISDASERRTAGAPITAVANNTNRGVRVYQNAELEGRAFADVLSFVTGGPPGNVSLEWSQHMLNGQYTRLTGYLGRQHGSTLYPTNFRFYADGVRIAEFELTAGGGLVHVDLDVFGVNNLRIEAINPSGSTQTNRIHGFAATIQ
ncbi:MAG: stalk domain-containing protein [Defluviitaleaceae bacterium]|nr:stalk domain-containing protein [Defluviitaleaceae bacterium]